MRNDLKLIKDEFSDFYFISYVHFCTKICQFSMNFHENSKEKYRFFFIFDLFQNVYQPFESKNKTALFEGVGGSADRYLGDAT